MKSFGTNRKDLQEMIDYCLEHHWRPVLITLPISQVLQDGLEQGYMKRFVYDNLKQINTHSIAYIDFSTNTKITKDKYLFSNSDHLNKKGAAIASYLLLQKLIDLKYLPKSADGYDYHKK